MNIPSSKTFKLALIGGLAGSMSYIIPGLIPTFGEYKSWILDAIINGTIFIGVGVSIIFSMLLLHPPLKKNKNILFIGGGIGSFIAGVFFYLGIGMYVAIVIFPVCLAITTKLVGLKGISLKIILGGVIGGIIGAVIGTLLGAGGLFIQHAISSLRGKVFDFTLAMLMVSVIIYFWNLGILIGANKWKA